MYFKKADFTGAHLLLSALTNQGYETVFGCSSETLLPILDLLLDEKSMNFIHMKHEQAAVHAADGFARATGKPGVALVGAGSGITNAVTGIATAYSDSVPLIVIVAQITADKIGCDSFQEVDCSGLTIPVTKQFYKVNHANKLPEVLQNAFTVAQTGRPGPIVIEVPANVLNQQADDIHEKIYNSITKVRQKKEINKNVLEHTITTLEQAKKPVILIGGGIIIAEASALLTTFIERTKIPVASTLMGIGGFDSNDRLYLGMLGMHGTFAANKSVHNCDVLLCLGVRFSDRVTGKMSGFSPKSTKIQVDIDASEINKIVQIDIPVVADLQDFLKELDANIDAEKIVANCTDWLEETTHFKKNVPRFDKSNSLLKPQEVIQLVDQFSNSDCIVVTDVGQHQIFTAHNYKFTKPRSFLSSGGLGTMGYGLPAAIGAAVAKPGGEIICVTGDGSFQMNLQELHTVCLYKLPIKIIILNNGYLGMVRQWQELFYDRRYSSVKISSPDFVKLAEANGLTGFKAKNKEEAEDNIQKAFALDGPVLLEFDVFEEENVYPMVPPSASNSEVILSK